MKETVTAAIAAIIKSTKDLDHEEKVAALASAQFNLLRSTDTAYEAADYLSKSMAINVGYVMRTHKAYDEKDLIKTLDSVFEFLRTSILLDHDVLLQGIEVSKDDYSAASSV